MRDKLNVWLKSTLHVSKDGNYRHQCLKENLEKRPEIFDDLKWYIQKAHNDAYIFFEKPTNNSLDPLEEEEIQENSISSLHYTTSLPMQTLKGYFGEVFAGIIAENFSPFGDDRWKVPAYLFRFHDAAFQYLEVFRQTGRTKESVFGRIGDDCLAFTLKNDEIEKILYCEAKCTKDHDPKMIKEAHEKFNESVITDLYKITQILKGNTSSEGILWYKALERFLLREKDHPSLREDHRYNFMTYVHGQLPVKKPTWLSEKKPHKAYSAAHPFEAVEIHLHDIEDFICAIYNKEETPLLPTSA